MSYCLQFASDIYSQLKPPRIVFDTEADALQEAERLLNQGAIAFTIAKGPGSCRFVDRDGYMLVRVVCHSQ